MRARFWTAAALLAIAATPVAAASGLRGIMHGWKADARATRNMLTGDARYDEAALRGALQTYVSEAGQVAAQIQGTNGQARDIKARFLAFQADAKTALADVSRPPALKADFSRVAADCESCHNVYNND